MAADPDLLTRLAEHEWARTTLGTLIVSALGYVFGKRARRTAAEDDAGAARAGAEESLYETLSRQLASFSTRLEATERALAEALARERLLQRQVDELTLANRRMALALDAQGITQPGGIDE